MTKHERLYNRIIDYANKTDNVRVVEMNGSRVNDQIEPDQYQDFDMVFYVKDYHSYMKQPACVGTFGNILVMQTKDDQIMDFEDEQAPWYIYLVQYQDGTRLDLTIKEVSTLYDSIKEDSLSLIVLDKDGYHIKQTPNESSYFVKEPTSLSFSRVVNEFYWVSPYVAKGIARKHFIYAYKHLDIIRNQLEQVLDWWIGIQHDFKISVGKGKHRYQSLLNKTYYDAYIKTFSGFEEKQLKQALIRAIECFDQVCKQIIKKYDFDYDVRIKSKMIDFLNQQYMINES